MDFGVLFLNFIRAKEKKAAATNPQTSLKIVFIAKTPKLLAKPNFVAITTWSRTG
jgi:hypothetical protein